ncbi:hypothetical protein [Roseivirga sp.]|uniref:DUF3108 domain-containing protein n=1 Tax=Roseivirga sp. TaxID=1964215 RepID=UPI003B51EBB7
MKKLLFTLIFILPVSQTLAQSSSSQKQWAGREIDLQHIQEVVNEYHMYNSDRNKVGSMIFGFWFEGGRLWARDTSSFDDGSVYEVAQFSMDTTSMELRTDKTDMQTPNADIKIDLNFDSKKVTGQADVKRANGNNNHIPIDDDYAYTIVRSEIYMLLHTLSLPRGDTLSLDVLVPNSLNVSKVQLYYTGEERVTTEYGKFRCDVYWLKTDGKMPENKIWVSKKSPRTIVRFHVPAASLDIELVNQREWKKD